MFLVRMAKYVGKNIFILKQRPTLFNYLFILSGIIICRSQSFRIFTIYLTYGQLKCWIFIEILSHTKTYLLIYTH